MQPINERVGAVPREAGRAAFGGDPGLYASARPPYPDTLYAQLEALHPIAGRTIFEIGPGTGIATARILAHRPVRHVAIEPDGRLGAFLAEACAGSDPAPEIVTAPWEDAALPPASFDIGIAATSFHWLDEQPALAKVVAALKPGGLWAMWWNIYADPDRPDPLRDAAAPLYRAIADTPSTGDGTQVPYMLDEAARLIALREAGLAKIGTRRFRWTIRMDAGQVRALAATYSGVALAAPEMRARLLDGLEQIVAEQFGGAVERPFMTALYWGFRPG